MTNIGFLPQSQERVFCMEATSVYGVALAYYLHRSGDQVIVANPMRTHAFVKMEMLRNKTDKSDTHRAQVLAALRVIVNILWPKVS